MFEKRLAAVSLQLFTANGTSRGLVTIADTSLFKVKQQIIISGTALPNLDTLEVKQVVSSTQLVIGPRTGAINTFSDISTYTTAANAGIFANEQLRPTIKPEEVERATFDEEPAVARRTILVDKFGQRYDDAHPLPVSFGTVALGDVRIQGPSGDEMVVHPDGSIDVNATVTIPPGISTEVKQDVGNASLASIDSKIPASPAQEHVTALSPHAVRLSDGAAFYKPTTPTDTQPVSATALPLPTGAATETTLAGIKTGTDKIPASPSQEHVAANSPHSTRLTDGTTFYKATTPADTQPISAAALPLPTGAATEVTLAGIKTGTDKIPASPSQEHVTAVSPHATRLTDGTAFYKATTPADTQPISAATLPLPAGAATDANQATEIASLASIDAKTPALVGGRQPVDGSGVTQPISAVALPLPTGAATEATLAGIKTGTDKIPASPSQEHVLANSPHAARLTDGTSFYKPTTPTDTQPISAVALPLPAGAATETTVAGINSKMAATTGTPTSVPSSASDVTLLALNASRKGFTLYNDSTQNCYVLFSSGTSSSSSFSVLMLPGAYYENPNIPVYTGAIKGIWAAANGNMRVTEYT